MRVELEIYSGRPNHDWTLTPAEATELAHRLVGVPPGVPRRDEPGLGYRGFAVDNPRGEADLPTTLRVYDGLLTIVEHGHVATYQDTNGIEAWLLDLARQQGHGELLAALDR